MWRSKAAFATITWQVGEVGWQKSDEVQQEVQSPAPGQEYPQALIQTGGTQLDSSSAEKVLGVLVGTELNISQQCACAT